LSEKPLAGVAPSWAIVLKSDIGLLLVVVCRSRFKRYGEGLFPSSGWTTHLTAKHHLDLVTGPGKYLDGGQKLNALLGKNRDTAQWGQS
jgi:hypothetical protein